MESIKARILQLSKKRDYKMKNSSNEYFLLERGNFLLGVYFRNNKVSIQPHVLKKEKVQRYFREDTKEVLYRIDTVKPHAVVSEEISFEDLSPERYNEAIDNLEKILSEIQEALKTDPDIQLVDNFWITRGI